MKWNSLLLVLLSLLFFNTAYAEKMWVKDKNQCHLFWSHSTKGMFKSVSWSGKCKNGYASGNGIAVYKMKNSTQDIYKGHMRRGKISGHGRYKWANKSTYTGEWKNNKMHGQGRRVWANKNRYAGQWKNSKMHGQGTHIWFNLKRYSGAWKNSYFHGKGKMTWKKPCPSCYKSFVGNFSYSNLKSGVYVLANGKKVNKKRSTLSDTTSTYLKLMEGYTTNRHLHYGN
ncbi:MAG: hypothetical protein KAH03_08210 [Cocleimonas sp.]|nr:hypothetical protein [Cocleimonas sp.]